MASAADQAPPKGGGDGAGKAAKLANGAPQERKPQERRSQERSPDERTPASAPRRNTTRRNALPRSAAPTSAAPTSAIRKSAIRRSATLPISRHGAAVLERPFAPPGLAADGGHGGLHPPQSRRSGRHQPLERLFLQCARAQGRGHRVPAILIFIGLTLPAAAVAVGLVQFRMRLQVALAAMADARLVEHWLAEQRFYRLNISAPEIDGAGIPHGRGCPHRHRAGRRFRLSA